MRCAIAAVVSKLVLCVGQGQDKAGRPGRTSRDVASASSSGCCSTAGAVSAGSGGCMRCCPASTRATIAADSGASSQGPHCAGNSATCRRSARVLHSSAVSYRGTAALQATPRRPADDGIPYAYAAKVGLPSVRCMRHLTLQNSRRSCMHCVSGRSAALTAPAVAQLTRCDVQVAAELHTGRSACWQLSNSTPACSRNTAAREPSLRPWDTCAVRLPQCGQCVSTQAPPPPSTRPRAGSLTLRLAEHSRAGSLTLRLAQTAKPCTTTPRACRATQVHNSVNTKIRPTMAQYAGQRQAGAVKRPRCSSPRARPAAGWCPPAPAQAPGTAPRRCLWRTQALQQPGGGAMVVVASVK